MNNEKKISNITSTTIPNSQIFIINKQVISLIFNILGRYFFKIYILKNLNMYYVKKCFLGKFFTLQWKQFKSAKKIIFKRKKLQNYHILDNEFIKVTKTKWNPRKQNICYWMSFSQIWIIPLVDDHHSIPSPPTWQIWKKRKKKRKEKTNTHPFVSGQVILWKCNSIEMGENNTRVDKQISFLKICVSYWSYVNSSILTYQLGFFFIKISIWIVGKNMIIQMFFE